jgi:hypothetical protein
MMENRKKAPFFRMEQLGAQKRPFINTTHPFCSDLHYGPDATPRMKTTLALLLFAVGSCELDATGHLKLSYQTERTEWSKRPKIALALLDRRNPMEDAEASNNATTELAAN